MREYFRYNFSALTSNNGIKFSLTPWIQLDQLIPINKRIIDENERFVR